MAFFSYGATRRPPPEPCADRLAPIRTPAPPVLGSSRDRTASVRHMPCSTEQCYSAVCQFQTGRAVHSMSPIALSSLTARQREIVMLAANGLSKKEIARRLGLSEGTVKLHLHNIYTRLDIRSRTVLLGWFTRPHPLSPSDG